MNYSYYDLMNSFENRIKEAKIIYQQDVETRLEDIQKKLGDKLPSIFKMPRTERSDVRGRDLRALKHKRER